MTNFWILMLIAITISLASQFFIKKIYGIDKSGWRYKHVSNTHKWIEITLLILFVVSLSFFPVEYLLLLFFIVPHCRGLPYVYAFDLYLYPIVI